MLLANHNLNFFLCFLSLLYLLVAPKVINTLKCTDHPQIEPRIMSSVLTLKNITYWELRKHCLMQLIISSNYKNNTAARCLNDLPENGATIKGVSA